MEGSWWQRSPDILNSSIKLKFNCPSLYESFTYLNPTTMKRTRKCKPFNFNMKSDSLTPFKHTIIAKSPPKPKPQSSSHKSNTIMYELLSQQISPKIHIIKESSKHELEIIYRLVQGADGSTLCERVGQFKEDCWHMELFNNFTQILFHCLYAQAALIRQDFALAAQNFQFCEYYARKEDLNLFCIHCLWEQSSIWVSLSKIDMAFVCLKSALEMSIVADNRYMELKALQKIGLLYYYTGNVIMSEYYHKLSEKDGLVRMERDFYLRQYSKCDQIAALEYQLFKIQSQLPVKRKFNVKYQKDRSRDLFNDIDYNAKHVTVSQMLKCKESSKMGFIIRRQIKKNLQIASIKHGTDKENKQNKCIRNSEHTYSNSQMPFEGCSQVLKSHLSRNRVLCKINREISLRRVIQLIQSLRRQSILANGQSKLRTQKDDDW